MGLGDIIKEGDIIDLAGDHLQARLENDVKKEDYITASS